MKILVNRSLSALVPLGSRDPRVRQFTSPPSQARFRVAFASRPGNFHPRLNYTLLGPAAGRDSMGADCAKRWLGCVDVAHDLDD
jgi:hypothetical protein